MTRIIIALCCSALVRLAAAGQTPAQAPKPCSAPAYHQFDFWIGDWDVFSPDGKVVGHSRIESIEGGCGIQENWTGAAGGTGRSLNTFMLDDKKWHQFWIGSGGGILHLSGTVTDGVLTYQGASMTPSGASMQNRLSFTKNSDGTVRQFWEVSADNGRTWQVSFDGKYVRQK
jgi:hypothetical protein